MLAPSLGDLHYERIIYTFVRKVPIKDGNQITVKNIQTYMREQSQNSDPVPK